MSKRRGDRFPDASAMWQALQAGAGVVPPVGLSGAFLSPQPGTPPFGSPVLQQPQPGARTAPLPAVTAPPALAPTQPPTSAAPPAPSLLSRKKVIGAAVGGGVLLGLVIFAATREGPSTFAAAVEQQQQKARAGEIIDRLQNGRTCRDRKVAALELIALDDARHLEVLRGARDRRGGWFGLQSANGCMARELDAAIRKLEAQK
jgi:hypothetical protein